MNMTDNKFVIFPSTKHSIIITRYQNLLVHAIGALFPASTLALIISYLFQFDRSAANSVAAYPVFLILLSLLLLRPCIPRHHSIYILLVFSSWVVMVFLSVSPINITSSVRLISILSQVVYYWASFLCFYREPKNIIIVEWYAACATISAILLANAITLPISFSPALRYEGLTGPNSHGFISATSIVALISLLSIVEMPIMRIALMIGVAYALVNLWATGSRLSIIVVLVFAFIYSLFTRKSLWRFITLMTLLSFGIFFFHLMLGEVGRISSFFRWDEYSNKIRLQSNIWGFEKALQNLFWPYGLATLAEEARRQYLDNSYLYLMLELGAPGLALILCLVALTIREGLHLISRTVKNSSERKLGVAVFAAFISMAFHGIGETALFVGIQTVNLLFWVTAAFLCATSYRMKRLHQTRIKDYPKKVYELERYEHLSR